MAAFQSGFQMGQRAYQQALDNKDREERRKAEEEMRAVQVRQIQMGIDAATKAAERQDQIDTLAQQLTRPNAENYTLTAKPAAAGMRIPTAPAAAPVAAGEVTDVDLQQAVQSAQATAAAPVVNTALAPAATGGMRMPGVGAKAAAAGIAAAPDARQATFNAAPTRGDAEAILGRMAILRGDTEGYRRAQAAQRGYQDEDAYTGYIKEYTGAEDQIGATIPYVNNNATRITMGSPDKNGLMPLAVVKGDGRADFLSLNKKDQARLYAGVRMMESNPTKAMEIIAGVNKELADAIAKDSGLQVQLANNANDVAGKSASITAQRNADARGASAEARTVAELDRQRTAERNLREALATLEDALQAGDPKAIAAARRGLLLAGGKLAASGDKVESRFEKNPVGMGGTAVQTLPNGQMIVTPIPAGTGPTVVPAPGRQDKAAPAQATGGMKAFKTEEEARRAWEEGRLKPTEYFTVNGAVQRMKLQPGDKGYHDVPPEFRDFPGSQTSLPADKDAKAAPASVTAPSVIAADDEVRAAKAALQTWGSKQRQKDQKESGGVGFAAAQKRLADAQQAAAAALEASLKDYTVPSMMARP